MYFLLAAVAAKFHLLSYGLALILGLIGTKVVLIDVVKIPVAVAVSLGVVVTVLALTMWPSPHVALKSAAESPPRSE